MGESSPIKHRLNLVNSYTIKEIDDLDDIVLSIVNGLDPRSIDPELYKYIYYRLEDEANYYFKCNPSGYKCIVKALDYIDEYNKYVKNSKPKIIYQPSKEELNEAVQIAIDGQDISKIDKRMYSFMINQILELRKKAVEQRDYDNSKIYENAFQTIVNLSEKKEMLNENEMQRDTLMSKLERTKKEYEELSKNWENELNELADTFNSGFKKMQEEDDKIIEEFDKNFNEPPPPRFTKYSPNVLNLRKQVESSINVSSEKDIAYLKNKLKKIEEAEYKQFVEKWHSYLKEKRKNLIDEQNKKENSKISSYKKYISKTEHLRDEELGQLSRLINKYKLSIERLNNTIADTVNQCIVNNNSHNNRQSPRRKNNNSNISSPKQLPMLKSPRNKMLKTARFT